MIEAMHILTLTPIKKGRKYFTCNLPDRSFPVKLVINDLSAHFGLNTPVAIRAKDQSRHTIFGSQIIYEAMQVLRGPATLADKIGQEIERSFQKASFRGIEVDKLLGVRGASWRSAAERGLVQCKWDARRQKRVEARAWKFASDVLPKEVYDAMKRPGVEGVLEALMNNAGLRASWIDAGNQPMDPNIKAAAKINVDSCRKGLETGEGRIGNFTDPNAIWMRAAGHVVASQLAQEADVAVVVTSLQKSTPAATTTARLVRL